MTYYVKITKDGNAFKGNSEVSYEDAAYKAYKMAYELGAWEPYPLRQHFWQLALPKAYTPGERRLVADIKAGKIPCPNT